jgi:ABC-type sulfate transport system permease component
MSGLVLVASIVGLIIAVLWILLPFAVFGSKDILRELVEQQKRTNALLDQQAAKPKT